MLMEVVDSWSLNSSSSEAAAAAPREKREQDEVRVKRKAIEAMLKKFQRALEFLSDVDDLENGVDDDNDNSSDGKGASQDNRSCQGLSSPGRDADADELCDMIKSQVGDPEFLQKIENAQASVLLNIAEDGSSWDMVSENDVWECENTGLEQEDYVLVKQEDIVEGVASFMAAYLLSLKHTKDLTPNQLQEALRKTFSIKKRKGKLRKAWDGSKVIYNVASWSATAIGIYQNPALLRAASTAFRTSCRVISKFF